MRINARELAAFYNFLPADWQLEVDPANGARAEDGQVRTDMNNNGNGAQLDKEAFKEVLGHGPNGEEITAEDMSLLFPVGLSEAIKHEQDLGKIFQSFFDVTEDGYFPDDCFPDFQNEMEQELSCSEEKADALEPSEEIAIVEQPALSEAEKTVNTTAQD